MPHEIYNRQQAVLTNRISAERTKRVKELKNFGETSLILQHQKHLYHSLLLCLKHVTSKSYVYLFP